MATVTDLFTTVDRRAPLDPADLVRIKLKKHYPDRHDQKDHGNWARGSGPFPKVIHTPTGGVKLHDSSRGTSLTFLDNGGFPNGRKIMLRARTKKYTFDELEAMREAGESPNAPKNMVGGMVSDMTKPTSDQIEMVLRIETKFPGLLEATGVEEIVFDEDRDDAGGRYFQPNPFSSGSKPTIWVGLDVEGNPTDYVLLHELGHALDNKVGGGGALWWTIENQPWGGYGLKFRSWVESQSADEQTRWAYPLSYVSKISEGESWRTVPPKRKGVWHAEAFADSFARYFDFPGSHRNMPPVIVDWVEGALREAGLDAVRAIIWRWGSHVAPA